MFNSVGLLSAVIMHIKTNHKTRDPRQKFRRVILSIVIIITANSEVKCVKDLTLTIGVVTIDVPQGFDLTLLRQAWGS